VLEVIKGANLAPRFLLELCALGYCGFETGGGLVLHGKKLDVSNNSHACYVAQSLRNSL
jgi:hypothetical protein